MELNYDILRKALNDMKEIHGITRESVMKASGVHNIQKIVVGKIAPLPDSWWKLHKAFPEYIPEPTYIDGNVVYKPVQSVTATGSTVNQTGRDFSGSFSVGHEVNDKDKELIKLLLQYGDDELKRDLKKKLIEKITERLM